MQKMQITRHGFYARFGLPPHVQKTARDKLKMKLEKGTVDGQRQMVYTSLKQVDEILALHNMIRVNDGKKEIIAKVVRKNENV